MPVATKKKASTAASAKPKWVSPARKPDRKKAERPGGPLSLTHIADLRAKLNYFIHPNFEEGDFWPRLDRRLHGLLPDLISQTLDALDAQYPVRGKPTSTARPPSCVRRVILPK